MVVRPSASLPDMFNRACTATCVRLLAVHVAFTLAPPPSEDWRRAPSWLVNVVG